MVGYLGSQMLVPEHELESGSLGAHNGLRAGLLVRRAGAGQRSDAMCHGYADLKYSERDAQERMQETIRDTTSAPVPAAEVNGLVAVLRALVEKVRPAKTTFAAE